MKVGRHRACRTGFLAGQAEGTNEHRFGRIAQVVDQRHAGGAPAGGARDEVSDAGVAFPPVLVCVVQSADNDGQAVRPCRLGDVPDFVGAVSECAEQVHLASVGARQLAAVAHTHHLRAAGFGQARLAWNVGQVLRLLRIGDVEDRRAVVLTLAGDRIHHLAAVMADVRNPARPLLVDERLIRAAPLKIVVADERHVVLLHRPAVHRRLHAGERDRRESRVEKSHGASFSCRAGAPPQRLPRLAHARRDDSARLPYRSAGR